MKFAKIRFAARAERVRAIESLMRRTKIVALKGEVFIVPQLAIEWLKTEKITFTLLDVLNQDDVIQALRNIITSTV